MVEAEWNVNDLFVRFADDVRLNLRDELGGEAERWIRRLSILKRRSRERWRPKPMIRRLSLTLILGDRMSQNKCDHNKSHPIPGPPADVLGRGNGRRKGGGRGAPAADGRSELATD